MRSKILLVALLALALVSSVEAQNLRAPGCYATVIQVNYGGSPITSANTISLTTSATKYSDAIKCDGANRFVFDVTAVSGQTDTHTVTVQTSPDGTTWAVAAAVVAEVGPTSTQVLNEVLTFTTCSSTKKRLTCVGLCPTNYVRLKFTAGTSASPAVVFYPVFCTYSYDGPAYDRRPVKVQQFTKSGVLMDTTNHVHVAGGAAGYTDGIKIEDCSVLAFTLNMVSSTSSATTHACKVQVSPDNTNWYDPVPEGSDQYIYSDLDAGWGATANTCRSWVVSGFLPAKYVRLYWTSESGKDVVLGAAYCITY
jgi:hypothetical protein